MRKSAIAVLLLVVLGNILVWSVANRPVSERPWAGMISGVGFSPYQADENPIQGAKPQPDDIDRDLKLLQGSVNGVRTYSSVNNADLVPGIAHKYGLSVTAGAWIQGKPEIDEPELANLIRVARTNPNVRRVIVGNEAILRTDVTVDQAIDYIKRVKRQVTIPVSTAEPWHVWLNHPELVEAVDFIAVHILPYWEGVPVDQAVDYSMFR